VHRCSESFASLASALAKAQAALVNPEKSLTATVRSPRPGEADRSFRYAPLASGLDIVRKTLGQHEIATFQTTAIDQAAGMVNLTTMLAHSSGEWIASDWPICPIAEMANPQRMGAALTYARRYALFTLVGIAGEDDLDAPDICAPGPGTGSSMGGVRIWPQTPGNGRMRATTKAARAVVLSAEESAVLRDRLLNEIIALQSQDNATVWAREALPLKNKLTEADANLVGEAFEKKLSEFMVPETAVPLSNDASPAPIAGSSNPSSLEVPPTDVADRYQARIDKSVLTVSAPRRYRNKAHLRFVTQQPCLLCGRKPSDAHHLSFVQPRALGRKASDEFAVPLCRIHHRAAHRARDEWAWWKRLRIDSLEVARKLWKDTLMSKPRDPLGIASHQPHQTLKPPEVDGKTP
jgi:ERF superfamily